MELNSAPDMLGEVIRIARERAGMSRSELAEKIGKTARTIMYIENNQQKPRYEVLFQLVRILFIRTDEIFYPELAHKNQDIHQINVQLLQCDKKSLQVVLATLIALLEE